jgi:hypothetical protein
MIQYNSIEWHTVVVEFDEFDEIVVVLLNDVDELDNELIVD